MSFKLLKYTQLGGFEEADAPFAWPEDQKWDEAFKAGGYGSQEESEGEFGYVDGMRHHYHDTNGSRITVIDGPCRWEAVYTANAADHLSLRIALAPLAHVLMAADLADIRAEHGTLKKWRAYQQDLDRRARGRA
jgi:hypothetical protein